MRMKKLTVILLVVAMSMTGMACGKKEEAVPDVSVENETVEESQKIEGTTEETEEVIEENVAEETEAPAEEEQTAETEGEPAAETPQEEAGNQEESSYEDNFAVDNEAAAAFAEKIKAAVSNQDLEALADLTAFPVYVGFADGGIGVNTREEFMELGAERIFTPEMVESVGGSQTTEFPPSMAGFVLNPKGTPDIVFGVTEGKLAIKGINY